jgi:hypothetical protein
MRKTAPFPPVLDEKEYLLSMLSDAIGRARRDAVRCGSLAAGLQSPPVAQHVALADARSVRGMVPGTAAFVCCFGFGYASPSAAHAKHRDSPLIYGGKRGQANTPNEWPVFCLCLHWSIPVSLR